MIQFRAEDRYDLLVEVVTQAGGKLTVACRPDISRARGALRAFCLDRATPAALAADTWLIQLGHYTDTKVGPPMTQSNQPIGWPHEV